MFGEALEFIGADAISNQLPGILSGHDVDLNDLKAADKCLPLYLCLPANRMGRGSRWLRLFINLALNAKEQERTMGTSWQPAKAT